MQGPGHADPANHGDRRGGPLRLHDGADLGVLPAGPGPGHFSAAGEDRGDGMLEYS